MLNKTIWLLWLQGWDTAPWLVKQVAESWEINNPDWNIEYVTLDNLHNYVHDIDYIYDKTKEIEAPAKSDIIRLSLLKNHGGVWADATMLCMQPLSTWAPEAVKYAGLWMYHGNGDGMDANHGPASWFMISEKDSLIINKWKNACDAYWQNRTNADSYFWLDGLFRKLFESDLEFRNKWELAPHLYCESTGQAHALYYRIGSANWLSLISLNIPKLKKIFLKKPPYILKLSWKECPDKFPEVDSAEFKNSNCYYAIQMSKRKFICKHKMLFKDSVFFRTQMFMLKLLFTFRMFFYGVPRVPQNLLILFKRATRKAKIIFLSKI
jgi:Capsular polysaccharide synthesis protein